jgi:hypothetical protein
MQKLFPSVLFKTEGNSQIHRCRVFGGKQALYIGFGGYNPPQLPLFSPHSCCEGRIVAVQNRATGVQKQKKV